MYSKNELGGDNMNDNSFDVRDSIKAEIQKGIYHQAAIAKKANLTPYQLSSILNKRRKLEANEFLNLCLALNMKPSDFLNDKYA